MNKKSVVILGGGYGGVHAAKKLYKKIGNNIEIILIDKKPYHILMTELHEVAGARTEPEAVQIKLQTIFAGTSVKIVIDEINEIDFSSQQLISKNNSYKYDYLILGAGGEPAFFGIPGVEEHSFTIWSFDDAMNIRSHITKMFNDAVAESDILKRKQFLTFVVAGAGFTGIEVIGELAEWTRQLCKFHKIDYNEVSLILVEAMSGILPIFSERLVKKSEKYLSHKKIRLILNAPIINAEECLVKLKDGTSIETKTLIWTCGVQGSSFVGRLGLTLGKRNRAQTNEYMQSVDYENVYIVGDNAYYEEDGKPIPQIVEAALQTAEIAVHNIISEIKGKDKKPFKSKYHGIMVSVGSRDAVADVMGFSTSGFRAMAIKHMVNLHYLFGIGGVRLVISYIMHEFFDIKENRSITGGHLSNKTPIFWLAILRVYLGAIWLLEGLKKVKEGWLDPAKNFVVTMPNATSLPQKTSDAVTSATQVTQYWPEPILKRPPAIYEWFMDTFIAPNSYIFQVSIVVIEIAIGLALIAGLFTLIASATSIFLCANFIFSAMAGTEILWHMFVAISLFGGAGRAFGLDYYVMPWLKEKWNNTKFVQRLHIYVD